jgi:hypothetical protein
MLFLRDEADSIDEAVKLFPWIDGHLRPTIPVAKIPILRATRQIRR